MLRMQDKNLPILMVFLPSLYSGGIPADSASLLNLYKDVFLQYPLETKTPPPEVCVHFVLHCSLKIVTEIQASQTLAFVQRF